ncbi:MAG: hypothetical protein WC828_07900 [Thermoleophilia bacterium]|jgi:hypothetical protein
MKTDTGKRSTVAAMKDLARTYTTGKPGLIALAIPFNPVLLVILLLAIYGCGENRQDTTAAEPVPATTASNTTVNAPAPAGYMTFAVNVHDTVHVNESADTILRLVDIFEKYGVRGDFYFTAPVTQRYVEQRPDVIARLRDSNMTISYHVRPPNPLYTGFDQQLKALDDTTLAATLRDYETYELDLATGGLIRGKPGGYSYVAQIFGRDPVTASAPTGDRRIKKAAEIDFADLGARMVVHYHEEGTDIKQPFVWSNGLLERPSDFSVTRWSDSAKSSNDKDPFWWNMLSTPKASQYNPASYLEKRMNEWQAGNNGRAPFVTSLIHENNFYRSGAEGWTLSYFADTKKEEPLSPPFDLNAPDVSTPRSATEQATIWRAYEEMVARTAASMKVVTSEDIVELAGARP